VRETRLLRREDRAAHLPERVAELGQSALSVGSGDPRTGICADCGAVGKTDWSNVDHRYRRVRADWAERCRSCYRRYDYARRLRLKAAA